MDEPHGCMPPHLYYRVTICEHTKNDNTVTNNSNEWVLPYVHKIGDGNDEAGGLTTLYTLLRDQEDAEDNGVFIRTKIRHLQSSATGTYNNSPIPPSLYASTEILISERRTMDVIQRQFFSSSTTTSTSVINQGSYDLVPELREFQNHLQKTLQAVDTTETLPFSLVQSDLKLILPYHTPSSSTSST
ncbi:hypothetical protein EC991_000553 [Linnemannia zychae]|nr:hypothetical protein EC991_000553 [Linnemannia zychae]